MGTFPSLPLFTDAFIADTGHLSAHATGAYLMLLMMAWRSPGCRLPDDDAKLARWARVDPRAWPQTKPVVMAFWELNDGYYTQKRLRKEFEFVKGRLKLRVSLIHKEKNGVRERKNAFPQRHIAPSKSLKNNKVASPPNPNPNKKERKQDARAREEKYHGKQKTNGLQAAYERVKQSITDDEHTIAEAERRDQKSRANIVRMLPDRRRS